MLHKLNFDVSQSVSCPTAPVELKESALVVQVALT